MTSGAQAQPVVVNGNPIDRDCVATKGVKISVTQATPVQKLDAQLESRLCMPNDVVFIDPQ
jgi:hypothetical protein